MDDAAMPDDGEAQDRVKPGLALHVELVNNADHDCLKHLLTGEAVRLHGEAGV